MKKKVLMSLLDSKAAHSLTSVLAEIEHELLTSAKEVDDALGGERIDRVPGVDARKEALRAVLQAIATDSVRDVWTDEMLPELVENPGRAESYVGMDADKWEEQMGRWADSYRDAGAEGSDRVLADHHVRDVFGVGLDTFERRIVEFSENEEAERLVAANFRAVRDVLDAAAEEVGE